MSHPFFSENSEHPFFEGTSNELRQGTATGRASVEHENIAENIYKLEQLRDQATDPKRKAHLENLIGNLKKQQTGWTRPKTESRIPGSNLARGVAAGVAAAGPLAADLALTIPDLMGSDLAERGRTKLQENVATTREFFDPQGGAGLIGEFAGGIAAGAPVYGPVANLTGKALASAPVVGKVLKPILTGSGAQSTAGRVASGAVGNVIAGAPINALQAAGIEGTTEDKLKVLGIGLGADALFGGAMRQPVFRENPQAPKTADIPARDEMIKRDAEILAGNQKAKAEAAERKAKTKAKTEAREAWKKANPDKKWSDLSNEAKNEIYAKGVPQAAPVEVPPAATEEQLKAAQQELARARAELAKNPGDAQAAGLAQAMENIIAKNTPQAAPPAAPAPKVPATPVGKSAIASMQAENAPKLSPEVQDFMLRKDLQKRYADAGIPYDPAKTVPQLTEELSAHMSNVRPKSPREELEYTIGVLKGRIPESPHMAPLLAELEAELRALGGTPTSTQAINAPTPQRSSRVPNPPTDAAQSIVGQPGATAGVAGGSDATIPSVDPQGSISGKVVGDIDPDIARVRASWAKEEARIKAMSADEAAAEIKTLQDKLGKSDVGEVLTKRYQDQIKVLLDHISGLDTPSKPHVSSMFDDEGFIDYADMILGKYVNPDGTPKDFVPTTPELEALYNEAQRRGIELTDIRQESYTSIGPDGVERVSATGQPVDTPIGKQNILRTEHTNTGTPIELTEGDIPGISSTERPADMPRDPREMTWEHNVVESIPDFNAVGKVLAEDVVNPMVLDAAGRPILVAPKGTRLNEELVAEIANLGYETVRTTTQPSPTAVAPPSPAPLPGPTGTQPSSSPSALPAVVKRIDSPEAKMVGPNWYELETDIPGAPKARIFVGNDPAITEPEGAMHLMQFRVVVDGQSIASLDLANLGNGTYGVSALEVSPKYRRKGIASKLYELARTQGLKTIDESFSERSEDGRQFVKAMKESGQYGNTVGEELVPLRETRSVVTASAKYGKMTKGQLGKLDDQLLADLDKMDPNSPEYAGKVADLQELTAEINRREQLAASNPKKGKKSKEAVPVEEPVNTRPYADLEGSALLDLRDQTQAQIEAFGKKIPKETQAVMDAVMAEINGRKTGTLQGPDFQAPEVTARAVSNNLKKPLSSILARDWIGEPTLGEFVDGPLYRETDIDSAINMLPTGETLVDLSMDRPFFANRPEYALGQGSNKGVLLEFDPTNLKGGISKTKPAWEVSYDAGYAEFEGRYNHQGDYQKAVTAITIKPGASSDKIAKRRLQHAMQALKKVGWIEEKLSDGSVRLAKPTEPPPINPAKFRAAPSKLSNADLDSQIDRIKYDIDGADDPDKVALFRKRLSDLVTEKTKRDAPPPQGPDGMPPTPTNGIKLQSHPAVGAFLGGYATGYFGPGAEDMTHEERLNRAFMWGAGSAGAIAGASYLRARRNALRKPKISNLLPGRNQVGIEKVVYSMDEINPPDRPFMEKMREFYNSAGSRVHRVYQNLFQSTEGLETFVERVGKKETPAENNPFKLSSLFGTWISRTEAFLAGRRPLTYVENGEPVQITNEVLAAHGIPIDPETGPAPLTLAQVLDLAEGDKYALGDLAVAYASLEGAGRGPVPMDVATREALIRSAHPKLRLAVKELRKYNIATALVLHKAGRLSLDGLQKMGQEDWYTPFHRIVEELERINATKRGKEKINAPNAIYNRKRGSKKAVLNPYEVSVDMTRRMLRAAEYGQLVESLVSTVEALPLAAQKEILRPVNKPGTKSATIDQMLAGDDLRAFMRTTKLSEADAKSLLAYVDDDTVMGKSGILTAYRNGQLHSYVIERPDIFEAMKSLMPTEINMLWKVLGIPTRVAARGTVLNPVFAWNQMFMDNFLAAINSKYGFRPGIDNVRGWYHSMTNSPQYQKMIDAGGPGSIAQLDYTNPNTALQALRTKGDNVVDTAVRNVKEMALTRAYKAFLYPLMEAPRVGEYLRALDHGESTLQAVYAAHEITGNMRMQGSLNGIRAMHQMTLFSRPALAGILKTAKELGVGLHAPEYNKTQVGQLFQKGNRAAGKIENKTLRTAAEAVTSSRAAGALSFMTKGIAYIAVPSIALWQLQKDDEEINQLRRTTGGQRYWFIRLPDGTITKHRKPHVIGQIFGTTVENILDQLQAEDPEALGRWLEGMSNDVSVNILPQIGVVPYSLWAGKSLGLNAPLTPRGDEAMSPALQGYDKASLPARVVADVLAPLSSRVPGDGLIGTTARRGMSPAGVDYVVGQLTGMLGQDGVRMIGAAMEYGNSGFLPPKEELPLIGRLMQAYPSMNVREVQAFYTRDAKVMQVAADLKWITENKPELIADFVEANITQIQMAPVHQDARNDIANLRRAIDDLRRMPDKTVSRQYQKSVEAHFIKLIEERLRVANLITDGMRPR